MSTPRTARIAGLALIGLIGAGCAPSGSRPTPPSLTLEPPALRLHPVLGELPEITAIAHAGDGSGRLFLATQRGRVLALHDGALRTLLDIADRARCCGEQGLLGLAFDPGFARNGHFYVSYTDHDGASVIARYRLGPSAAPVDPDSGATILRVAQPTPIHNGGAIAFGPDGMLYIALGDGGHFGDQGDSSGTDPRRHAQRLTSLLGKVLRIDVSAGLPYRIPSDNPFAALAGARPEVWAYGLRNPWRMSFDRATGDLFIADVGPSLWEEINWMPRGTLGSNFGWSDMLGRDCFGTGRCDPAAYTPPILLYDHDAGCAVIGGYRYRGQAIAGLQGAYLFGDFCSGTVWGGRQQPDGRWTRQALLDSGLRISTFGEDEAGELYLVDYASGTGGLYRLAPAGSPAR